MRAASDSKFSASMSNMSKAGMKTEAFNAAKNLKQKDNDSIIVLLKIYVTQVN